MQDNPTSNTVTNLAGDVLISRDGLPAVFISRNSNQIVIRDRVALALITMQLAAHADFEHVESPPPGLDFVISFRTKNGLRSAYVQASRIEPAHGPWLMSNYDLIVVGNRIHLLHPTQGTAWMLATSLRLAN